MKQDSDGDIPSKYVEKKVGEASLKEAQKTIKGFEDDESSNRHFTKSVFLFIGIIFAAIVLSGFLITLITEYFY